MRLEPLNNSRRDLLICYPTWLKSVGTINVAQSMIRVTEELSLIVLIPSILPKKILGTSLIKTRGKVSLISKAIVANEEVLYYPVKFVT